MYIRLHETLYRAEGERREIKRDDGTDYAFIMNTRLKHKQAKLR